MRIIEIEKSYLNGTRTGHIIVFDDELDNEAISDKAEDWCQIDGAGHNHGYEFSWKEVEDEKVIQHAISKEVEKMKRQVEELKNDLETLAYGISCKANNEFSLNGNSEHHVNFMKKIKEIWKLQNDYNLKIDRE